MHLRKACKKYVPTFRDQLHNGVLVELKLDGGESRGLLDSHIAQGEPNKKSDGGRAKGVRRSYIMRHLFLVEIV